MLSSENINNIDSNHFNNDNEVVENNEVDNDEFVENDEVIDNDEVVDNDEFDYSDLSKKLTKGKNCKLDSKVIKNEGIYFTPPETIHNNLELLQPYLANVKTILEPSCGSCEYILALHKLNQEFNIVGVENNKDIFNEIKSLKNDKISLYNDDFLKFNNCSPDLIIGNPPYFVMDKNIYKDIDKTEINYNDYFTGRPNIFILFIIKSLHMLNDNGILSFVLPKSFLNCHYYDKTRKYINEKFEIIDIVECNDKYIKTQQGTIIIIIKKNIHVETNFSDKNNDFRIIRGDYTLFGTKTNIIKLKELFNNSTTLQDLNINCKIGNIVWNQVKDSLDDDENKTLLIYNSNITNNSLSIKDFKNESKKQYIIFKPKVKQKKNNKKDIEKGTEKCVEKYFTEPVLVINRGNGNGKYHFNYCLINETGERKYLLENHIIKLEYNGEIDKNELIKLYKKIITSFDNPKTKKFIDLYFANNAVNTTELCNMLPIYGFDT